MLSPLLAIALAGCGDRDKPEDGGTSANAKMAATTAAKDEVRLTARQIADAGITVARPSIGGVAGVLDAPALIQSDPQAVQIVSSAIGGRIVALTRNLGQPVRRGDPLAIIESREAAALKAEVEAARARAALAATNLRREQRLFAERVSPEQDLAAARTAAAEANIALRLAEQQIAATGSGGGALNRIAIRSPIAGQVIARPATLGQAVDTNAELYRIANLTRVSITASLSPADAGRVRPGTPVKIVAAGREQTGHVTFVSPVLDEATRLVQVIAGLDNIGGQWRVGEPVTASFLLGAARDRTISVPMAAVQIIDNHSVVFVRTPTGFRAVPVVAGRRSGDDVVIASGLTGSEQVATTNSFTLKAELGKGGNMEME